MKVTLTTKYVHEIYSITRIVVGILFFSHGIQKIIALTNGTLPTDNLLLILATIIESIGGLLIILGWQTHLAAFISSGEMAVAYFIQHAPKGLLPINNGGELAVFYCFVFLFISAYGSGKWSLDNKSKNLKT